MNSIKDNYACCYNFSFLIFNLIFFIESKLAAVRGLADSDSDDDTAKWVQKQKSKLQVEISLYLMWLVRLLVIWLFCCFVDQLVRWLYD